MTRITRRLLAVTCGSLALSGCLGAEQPHLVLTQPAPAGDEVATVGLATTMVKPWQEIATDMNRVPFNLDASQLVTEAVPTTSSYRGSYNDALAARVAATFAGADIASQSETVVDADGVAKTTSSRTVTRNSPAAPDADAKFGATPPVLDASALSNGETGISAQMKYRAAAALAEEIAIINNRLSSIPEKKGFRPYFVSLQLVVHPRGRGYPYDTSVQLAFTTNMNGKEVKIPAIPLLVVDALEGTRESDVIQIARQLGAGLKASSGFFGIGANLERTIASLEQSESLRPNSLYSIGKSGENQVEVRLGANRFGNEYEMIPGAHNISLVLLVPTEAIRGQDADIRVTSSIDYSDAMAAAHRKDPTYTARSMSNPPGETIPIPHLPIASCPPPQDALVGESSANLDPLSLTGGSGLRLRNFDAILTTPDMGKVKGMHLAATGVIPVGPTIQFQFPSHVAGLNAGNKLKVAQGGLSFVVKETPDGDPELRCPASGNYRVVYIIPPVARPAPTEQAAKKPVADADKKKDNADAADTPPVAAAAEKATPTTAPPSNPTKIQTQERPLTLPM